jgi:hypothetical protein
LWALVATLPLWAAAAAIFASAAFVPAINAPVLGLFTLRTPAPLRGKVMTALFTTNSIARPASFALSGPLLQLAGLTGTFVVVATGLSAAAVIFVTALAASGFEVVTGDEAQTQQTTATNQPRVSAHPP